MVDSSCSVVDTRVSSELRALSSESRAVSAAASDTSADMTRFSRLSLAASTELMSESSCCVSDVSPSSSGMR